MAARGWMVRLGQCAGALIVATSLTAAKARCGESVVAHLPANTLGFAVVHDLAATDAKVHALVQIFGEALDAAPMAPLAFVKAVTGFGPGLDEHGDALLALLPGEHGAADARPLLLAPVSDYAAFAEAIGGDASGEICRVAIAGEEVLVARRGEYALLMNLEHRPVMETLLSAEAETIDSVTPLASWIDQCDVALVLTRRGVEALVQAGREQVAEQRAIMADQFGDAQLSELLEDFEASAALAETLLDASREEFDAAGVGIVLDDATNLRITQRIALRSGGVLAALDDVAPLADSPLASIADKAYVFAFGGPLPAQLVDRLSGVLRRLMERYPEAYGFQAFTPDQWAEVETTLREGMQSVRSTATVFYLGEPDDPLLSNYVGVTRVDDSAKYLALVRTATEKWNQLLSKSSSDLGPKMAYEIEEREVGGKPALRMTADIVAAAEDERMPFFAPVLKTIVGNDGKFVTHVVAADAATVVSATGEEEIIVEAVAQALRGEASLADAPATRTTRALLEPQAPWQFLLSPRGAVAWVSRCVAQVFAQFGGGFTIPEFPESPPLGASMAAAGDQLHLDVVAPVETLRAIADYAKTIKNL